MIRVLEGDCRTVLPALPAESVQCVVTSPPYYELRDYGVAGQLGLEATPDEYIQTMVAVFREVRRVLRPDGTCWVNMGDSYNSQNGFHRGEKYMDGGAPRVTEYPDRSGCGLKPKDLLMMPARLALALQADGWWLRSDIIWAKPNPMPESVIDRPTSAHEHIFLLTKSERYYYDADAVREEGTIPAGTLGAKGSEERFAMAGVNSRPPEYKVYSGTRNLRNVWTIATAPFPEAHFATFPSALAERCIKAGTSERGCCAQCGKPWVRERTDSVGGKGSWHDHRDDAAAGMRQCKHGQASWDSYVAPSTTGWAPACQCNAPTQPCTVLDPFGGAGTTGLVADRLQRDAIMIELSPAYCAMLRNRITNDMPLFAPVA